MMWICVLDDDDNLSHHLDCSFLLCVLSLSLDYN